MRVKKLELIGFKSFAAPTSIHFGDGVTCIVGPNGCGKSNISDAIRWVFGERSAKLLRGSQMEDVIFGGTDLRKPMGMAEVSLTLDNSDHKLPIEYDEVVLTRRMDRSGQSEYLLNRTPCRLKDILDLILDTGMGSNSYSMIEQGRVDAVVQADPQDRRFLIEEAAGISKYKVKKLEAVRKLERTEQNLLRIRDVVTEVQRNIQYAERQARRAERYKTQFEELKRLESQKAFLDLGTLDRQEEAGSQKKHEATEALGKIEQSLQELLGKRENQNQLLEKALQEEAHSSAHYFELRSEHRSLLEKQAFNGERQRTFRERQIEIIKEIELLESNLLTLQKDLQIKSAEHSAALKEQEGSHKSLEEVQRRFKAQDTRWQESRKESENLKGLLFEKASELARLHNEQNRLQTLSDARLQERERRKMALEKLAEEKREAQTKRLSYQQQVAEPLGPSAERATLNDAANLLQTELKDLSRQIAQKNLLLQEAVSRLKLLEELEQNTEDWQKELLASLPKDGLKGKLVRSLREVLKIRSGYESAVEAVLGAFAHSLVAEDVDTAKDLLSEMAQSHVGSCGIFIQSLAKPNGKIPPHTATTFAHPQIKQSLNQVVQVEAGFEPIFQPLFHNVFMVEEFAPEVLGELLPLAEKVRLVTRQGILIGPESRIFFRNGRLSPDQSSLGRCAEIDALKTTNGQLAQEIRKLEDVHRFKEGRLQELLRAHTTFEENEREDFIQRRATESLLRGLGERVESIEEEIRVLCFEIEESDKEIAQLQSEVLSFESQIRSRETEELERRERQMQLEKLLEEIRQEREKELQALERTRTLAENHQSHLAIVESGETLLKNQIQNIKDRTNRLTLESEELARRIQESTTVAGILEKDLQAAQKKQSEVEQTLAEIRGQKAYQETALREIQKAVTEETSRIQSLRENLHALELQLVDLTYQEKTIVDRIQQTYHVNLTEIGTDNYAAGGEDPVTIESAISTLKQKVDAFGPVNLLAIEEYEELKSRYEFLSGQEKDLNEARESLLEAIRKINRTTKTLFAETFAKAHASFQEYFKILFGGGHAELLLIEGGEDEEVGVDIVVRPPGKKVQHISLLSGGEKTLTAMALLFALFRIRPSPLCVLDEVDAALDEVNVDRFLAVLKTFLDSTQYLIVTHNRKTIASGDYLYGITMEESGVSKLVSVKLSQATQMAESGSRETVPV